MDGLMQNVPLTIDRVIDHAASWHGGREVVSRELSDMTREGWLARDRRAIRILRVAEMQHAVTSELRAPAA